QNFRQRVLFVVNRNDHRQFRIIQRFRISSLSAHICPPQAEVPRIVSTIHLFLQACAKFFLCLCRPSTSNNSAVAPRKPTAPPSSVSSLTAAAYHLPHRAMPNSSSSTPVRSLLLLTSKLATPSVKFTRKILLQEFSSLAAMRNAPPKNSPLFPAYPL